MFMLSFAAYFRVFESTDIQTLSPTQLGLSKSVTDLPDTKPYGLWVDRHGNFITTKKSHSEIAKQLLTRAGLTPKDDHEAYNVLFKNGFVRVVLTADEVLYGAYDKSNVTQSQLKLINFIKDFYNLDIVIFGKEIDY